MVSLIFVYLGLMGFCKMQYKAYSSLKKVKWVGKDQFIIHKRELLESEAWKTMSINCFHLITLLETEYMSCAGQDNGHIFLTYHQIENFGIRYGSIKNTIKEAIKRGLIFIELNEKVGKYGKYMQKFGLTYLPININSSSESYFIQPTNEWKNFQKGSVKNDTYICDKSDTYKTQKIGKNNEIICDKSDTSIYILGANNQNERSAVNE